MNPGSERRMSDPSTGNEYNIVLDLLCCVMIADGKASREEKLHIVELMSELSGQPNPDAVAAGINRFGERVKQTGFKAELTRVCREANILTDVQSGVVVAKCVELAKRDGMFHAREKRVIDRIQREVDECNKHFGKWEQIKKFELTPEAWTIDAGHLTPTMKMRRKIIKEKYKNLYQKIYNS